MIRRNEAEERKKRTTPTFPRASSAPSKNNITPSSIKSPPNVVSATPISEIHKNKNKTDQKQQKSVVVSWKNSNYNQLTLRIGEPHFLSFLSPFPFLGFPFSYRWSVRRWSQEPRGYGISLECRTQWGKTAQRDCGPQSVGLWWYVTSIKSQSITRPKMTLTRYTNIVTLANTDLISS